VIDDATQAYDYGIRFFHVHARNPQTGLQFADLQYYRAVFEGIRSRNPGALVGGATSRKAEVERQIAQEIRRMVSRTHLQEISAKQLGRIEMTVRAVAVEARPDRITTFTPPEIRITGTVSDADYNETVKGYSELTRRSWNRPDVMRWYYWFLRQRCIQLGVGEELEITTDAAFPVIEQLSLDPSLGLPKDLFVLFLFGYSNRLPIERRQFDKAMNWVTQIERRAGVNAHVTVGAAIAPHAAARKARGRNQSLEVGTHDYREVFEWVVQDPRVDSFRVGLEDVPELYGCHQSNTDLAKHAAELCDEYGVRVMTDPYEIRDRRRPNAGAPSDNAA
jgi:uncharacterized protein (DUF849 family)